MAKQCPSCKENRSGTEFRADLRRKDNLAHICKSCEAEGVKAYGEDLLETVDIERVEWMAADVRIFGSGACPPAGEVYSTEFLEQVAADTNEVLDELKPYNKLGHSEEQRLARASGLYTEDDEPATGWLTDWRVEEGKLVSGAKAVPKTLAKLFEAGAYRTRSPEIVPYKSQETGKEYKAVVRAGAWYGVKPVAFKTLSDVYALYHEDDENPDAVTAALMRADHKLKDKSVLALEYAAGDVVWDPETSFNGLMEDLRQALNPGPGWESRYWVRDISFQVGTDPDGDPLYKALVCESGSDTTWVVPFDIEADGRADPAPSNEWVMADEAWVEASNAYAEGKRGRPADTPAMPEGTDNKTGEEQEGLSEDTRSFFAKLFKGNEPKDEAELVKMFAEAAGVPDETDPEKIREAVEAKAAEAVKPPEQRVPEGMKLMSESDLEDLSKKAEAGVRAEEQLRLQTREYVMREAMSKGKFDPGEREDWERRYDENPDWTKEILEKLPEQDKLKVHGQDDLGGESVGRQFSEADADSLARSWGLADTLSAPTAAPAEAKE